MMIRMFDSNGSGTIGYDEFWYVNLGQITLSFSYISIVTSGDFLLPGAAYLIASMKTRVVLSLSMNMQKP